MYTPSVYLFLRMHTTCCRACVDSACPELMLPVVEPQTTAHTDIDSEEAKVPWHHQLMAIGETSFTMHHHPSPCVTICHSCVTILYQASQPFTLRHHSEPSVTIVHHLPPVFTMRHHLSPLFTMQHHPSPTITIVHHASPSFTICHHQLHVLWL